jgi:hypothetical protein
MRGRILLSSFLLFLLSFPSIAIFVEGAGEVRIYRYYYDRNKAVNYALEYGEKFNITGETGSKKKGYYDFQNHDCANFVSHCVFEGGWQEKGNLWDWSSGQAWFFHNPLRVRIPYFNIILYQGYTYTWTVAKDFTKFIEESKRGERVFSERNEEGVSKALSKVIVEGSLDVGDILLLTFQEKNGKLNYHVMIITGIKNGEIFIAHHGEFPDGSLRREAKRPFRNIVHDYYSNEQYLMVEFSGWHLYNYFND